MHFPLLFPSCMKRSILSQDNMYDGGWMNEWMKLKKSKSKQYSHHASGCCQQRSKFAQCRDDWKERPLRSAHISGFVFDV